MKKGIASTFFRITKGKLIFFALLLIWGLFFKKFFLNGLLPIPADITVGAYYPWLDYQWGYSTGVPIKNPLPSDIPSIIYPWRIEAVRAFKEGYWPLWSNGYFLGMPLLANFQSAVFSPANLFFLFLRDSLAWTWGVVLQPLLLMLAMLFYLKNRGLKTFSALLGSIVFAFSGFAVVWNQYNVHGWTMFFLPVILFLTDKYFNTGKKGWLFWLSLGIACQIFSGYLPIVVYSWLVIFGSILFFRRINRRLISWLVFVIFGLCLAAIQILPGLELISLSIRKIDPTSVKNLRHLPLSHILTLVSPNFFGNPATRNYWGAGFYDNFSFWVGAIPLVLSVLSLFYFKKKKEVIFWWLVAVLGFVLATNNPLGGFLERIFLISGGISARALFLVDFALAVLATLGFEAILKNYRKVKKNLVVSNLVTLFLLTSFSFFILFFIPGGASYFIDKKILMVALRNSALAGLVWFFFFGLFLFSFSFGKRLKKIFFPLVLILVVFDLWYPAQKYWSFTPEELIFPKTPIIDFLKGQKKPFRFEPGETIPQNMWFPYQLEAASGYDTLLPREQGRFISLVENGFLPGIVSRTYLIKDYQSNLFPLLNVKYVLTKKMKDGVLSPGGEPSLAFKNQRYQLVFEDKTVQIYQDKQYLERLWSVDQVQYSETDQIVDALTSSLFNPKETALVMKKEQVLFSGKENFLRDDLTKAEISFVEYSPVKEKITIESKGNSFLVESAPYYPGWQAFLDGQEIEIFKTDYALRGYFIPGGKHQLEITYNPKSFAWGKRITFFSLSFWLMALIFRKKKGSEI